ncbi:MAG: hypothetical protein ABI477_02210 [Chryseolinea sp.]
MNVERISGAEKRFYSRILRETVVNTIVYFDIFKYPLKIDEVIAFMGISGFMRDEVQGALDELTAHSIVSKIEDFYSLHDDNEKVSRRLKGNIEAAKHMPMAMRWARFISNFPFVRGVLISGSLSKGYMDEKSDLDFFIITASGRLWITRMLLVVFKRIFLFGSHKNFCVNYFVDSDNPKIAEENIFTATELATLIPFYGAEEYDKLVRSNLWLREYLPNWQKKSLNGVPKSRAKGLKKLLECVIDHCSPKKLNDQFRALTVMRWKRLYEKEYNKVDFDVVFKSNEHVSKNHPRNFQKKVLTVYQQKIDGVHLRLTEFYSYQVTKSAV